MIKILLVASMFFSASAALAKVCDPKDIAPKFASVCEKIQGLTVEQLKLNVAFQIENLIFDSCGNNSIIITESAFPNKIIAYPYKIWTINGNSTLDGFYTLDGAQPFKKISQDLVKSSPVKSDNTYSINTLTFKKEIWASLCNLKSTNQSLMLTASLNQDIASGAYFGANILEPDSGIFNSPELERLAKGGQNFQKNDLVDFVVRLANSNEEGILEKNGVTKQTLLFALNSPSSLAYISSSIQPRLTQNPSQNKLVILGTIFDNAFRLFNESLLIAKSLEKKQNEKVASTSTPLEALDAQLKTLNSELINMQDSINTFTQKEEENSIMGFSRADAGLALAGLALLISLVAVVMIFRK